MQTPSITAVVLRYLESDWEAATLRCVQDCRDLTHVVIADRAGVGNMSKAFNAAFRTAPPSDLVWFVTNVVFEPHVPLELARAIYQHDLAAIHPAHQSDHQSHRSDGTGEVREVPYLEFTAPMMRWDVFARHGLDEDHHYAYMDLILSKRLREEGSAMAVHHGAPVGHDYLVKKVGQAPERVTLKRRHMREARNKFEQILLQKKFGARWRDVLWAR